MDFLLQEKIFGDSQSNKLKLEIFFEIVSSFEIVSAFVANAEVAVHRHQEARDTFQDAVAIVDSVETTSVVFSEIVAVQVNVVENVLQATDSVRCQSGSDDAHVGGLDPLVVFWDEALAVRNGLHAVEA